MILFRVILFFLLSTSICADDLSFSWYTRGADQKVQLNVALFLSSTCEHCQKTDAFFHEIQAAHPWLHIKRNYINQDKAALVRFSVFLSEQHAADFAVPSVIFCDSRWVGFDSAQTTGKDLLKALEYCKQQLEDKGELTQTTVTVLKRWAHANLMNSGVSDKPSATYYLLLVSFLDAFNPCALFTFAAFFALFFMQKDKKNRFQSAMLFIIGISASHYLQQTQAPTFFQLLAGLRVPLVFFGFYTLYLTLCFYKKFGSCCAALSRPILLLWSFLFACFLQSYQQTCVMNWSYIFEQWLHSQNLPQVHQCVLQFMYQSVYLIPFILMYGLFSFVSGRRFFSDYLFKMYLISLVFIAAIAVFFILWPSLLSQFFVSFLILLALAVLAWLIGLYLESKDSLPK